MDEIKKELEGIRQALDTHNDLVRVALDAIPKPESRLATMLKTAVLVVGALGFIHTADVIRRWITGG